MAIVSVRVRIGWSEDDETIREMVGRVLATAHWLNVVRGWNGLVAGEKIGASADDRWLLLMLETNERYTAEQGLVVEKFTTDLLADMLADYGVEPDDVGVGYAADDGMVPRRPMARCAPTQSSVALETAVETVPAEVVVRIKLGPEIRPDLPLLITQENCAVIGLTKRQFLDWCRAGIVRGTRLPMTRLIAVRPEDILRVAEAGATVGAPEDKPTAQDDGADAVLAEFGLRRVGPKGRG